MAASSSMISASVRCSMRSGNVEVISGADDSVSGSISSEPAHCDCSESVLVPESAVSGSSQSDSPAPVWV